MRALVISSALLFASAACGEDAAGGSTNETAAGDTTGDATGGDTSSSDSAADSAADTTPADTTPADTTPADTTPADTAVDTTPADTAADTTADTAAETSADTAGDGDSGEVATGCELDPDCVACAFDTQVASPDDCYCVFCPSFPMTAAECAANTSSWVEHCDPWPSPEICPVASCIFGAPPICDAGQCVANPNGCFADENCGSCRFGAPPKTPEDCQCPMCPVPLATAYCEEIELAVSDLCADFDFKSCPPPPCAFPPPITCTDNRTCGYGDFGPER